MPKTFILFLDALDGRELEGYLSRTVQGNLISGIPRVTPQVLGSIYTGKSPAEHGLVRPTPLYQPPVQRPQGETIIEKVGRDYKTFSYFMPFTWNVNAPNLVIAAEGMGGNEQAAPIMRVPNFNAGMVNSDPEALLQGFVDYCTILFSKARQFMRNNIAEVAFVSFRNLDSFTHWHYGGDYRQRLIQWVAQQVELCEMQEDTAVLWFSDHGGCPATHVFRVNQWLHEKGYLDWQLLENRHAVMTKNSNSNFPDQVDIAAPFVELKEGSKAYSADAFDACVDVFAETTEAEIEQLRAELEATGFFRKVYRKQELYPGADDRLPELIPDRKPGILVSGNIHPRAADGWLNEVKQGGKTVCNSRDGDHSDYGCFGANKPLKALETVTAQDFYHVIDEFIASTQPQGNGHKDEEALTMAEEQQIRQNLERMGYA